MDNTDDIISNYDVNEVLASERLLDDFPREHYPGPLSRMLDADTTMMDVIPYETFGAYYHRMKSLGDN